MYFSGVDKVEDLHHHKSIKDKCEMTRMYFSSRKSYFIIWKSTRVVEPTTANSPTNYPFMPFIIRIGKF